MPETRVLQLIDHMGIGGAQRIAAAMAEKDSHEIHSLRTVDETTDVEEESLYTTSSRSYYNIRCLADILMLLKEKDYDVLHCHLSKSKVVGIFAKLFPSTDVKIIFHEHGRIFQENLVYDKFLRVCDFLVDRHVAVSDRTKQLLQQKSDISEEKIEKVYNFSQPKVFNPEEAERLGENGIDNLNSKVSEKTFLVGFAGRITERKGWRELTVAAEKQDRDIGVVIAGSGPEDEELSTIAENTENLSYVGYVEDIRTLFGIVDCFAIPSHWDPCPLVFFEAQASGVPVISSDAPSLNELIEEGENAIIFERKNTGKLAERIQGLKDDPELQEKLKKEGLKFAERNKVDTYRKKLESVYRKAMKV